MEPGVGRVELIIGPMFAGKTTELLRRVDRAKLGRRRCIVIKFSRDTRYSQDSVATHDMRTHIAIPCDSLLPHLPACLECDLIAIDEGQFFPDLVEFTERLTDHGKTVIIAGLDGTFQRKPFGPILELIAKSESILKLSAICTATGAEAAFSKRTVDSQELEVIGGAEIYSAASRSAFFGRPATGEVHLTLGPVKAGKTTELKRVLKRHQIAGRKPVLLRPEGGDPIGEEEYPIVTIEKLPPFEAIAEFDTVGIDEAQRFPEIAEWADEVANRGKLVEVSALDGDYDREPFRNIIECVSVSERVQKLDSICPITGQPAPFSAICDGVGIPISRLGIVQYKKRPVGSAPIVE
jgi:thymidine kinase